MIDLTAISSSIRARLFRPPVVDDYVRRKNLESILEDGQHCPIIVVSAPAGYGKSTQISHWVGQTGVACVWISLDSAHNDFGTFLRHLEAGVSDWSPPTAELLRKIANTSDIPPANYVADAVSTNMDDASDKLILVFDDYHEIHEAAIHLFIESLLMHMPDTLRIAIVSRRTPPIALSRLRSRNLVLDIRLEDLQFDRSATQDLVTSATGADIDKATLDRLEEVTEGWPAGLRMLLLALSGKKDVQAFLSQFEGNLWQIQEYLAEEVIRHLPENVAKHVATIAILDRFSADLCEALIASIEDDAVSGMQMVELIRNRGLFCIPLDERGEWYRFHHLFRDLLLRQLQSRYSDAEMQNLHADAAKWLDNDGQIEEAVQHYLRSDNHENAVSVILRHKDELIEQQKWRQLDHVLNLLPPELISDNLELLVISGWIAGRLGRNSLEISASQLAQEKLDSDSFSYPISDVTLGQFFTQRCTVQYHFGDGKAALATAEKALELLPSKRNFERAEATMLRGISMQMLGEAAAGRKVLFDALEQPGSETHIFRARILMGFCYLSWANGDLHDLRKYAENLLELGQSQNDSHAIVHACWFGGVALYQLNELEAAVDIVQHVTREKWWPHQRSYSNCIQILSLIHAARGEETRALELSEMLVAQSLESRSTYHLTDIHAWQAELALTRGDPVAATHWALEFETGELTAGWGISVAALTAARILLHSDLQEAQEKVATILEEHQTFYEETNNIRFLIETLALRAMYFGKLGDEKNTNNLLSRAVSLAEPNGFVRVFVDLGPALVPLLNRLELREQQLVYVGTILAAFEGDIAKHKTGSTEGNAPPETAGLSEALSKREKEVLDLLAQRLTNKEIGARLFIAPETVKRHAHNIFEKLNVNSRQAARAKAIGLGLVSV